MIGKIIGNRCNMAFIKDKCPSCGHAFGWRGPSFQMPEKGNKSKKLIYSCPKCKIELKRVVSKLEFMASTIGNLSLFFGASGWIWKKVSFSQFPSKNILLILYSVGAIALSISIFTSITQQHYFIEDKPG